jgi:L-lactate dehydrogenase (cytochrome)
MSDTFSFRDYPLASHSAPRTGAAKLPSRLSRVLSLAGLELAARRHLPKPIFA